MTGPRHATRRARRAGFACTGALLVGVAWTSPAAGADLPEVKAQGVLRVIIAADESPDTFALTASARPGFEREIMEKFAQRAGVRLDVVRAPGYADRIPMLLRGEGDVIAAIFDTPDRREKVAFTAEVIPTHNVAVTIPPRASIRRLEDLRALRVGVIRGTKPAEAAADAGIKPHDLVAYAKIEDLLRALKSGEIGAAVLPVSELALAAKRVAGLEAGITVGAAGTVAWAVRKEDTALREALDDFIGGLRKSPSWNRLVVQYFGDQALSVLGRAR